MLKLFTNDPEFSPRLAKKRAPYFPCAAFPWGPATHDTPDWSNRIPPRLGGRFDAVKKLGTISNNNCMRTKSLTVLYRYFQLSPQDFNVSNRHRF